MTNNDPNLIIQLQDVVNKYDSGNVPLTSLTKVDYETSRRFPGKPCCITQTFGVICRQEI